MGLYYAFNGRGGHFWDASLAGRFYFGYDDGSSDFDVGFRPVVIPKDN